MAFVQLGRYYTNNFSKCITRSQIDKGQIIIQTFLMYGICHQNFKNMSNSVSNKKFFKLKERPTTMSTKFKNILHNDTVLQNQKKVQLGIASQRCQGLSTYTKLVQFYYISSTKLIQAPELNCLPQCVLKYPQKLHFSKIFQYTLW